MNRITQLAKQFDNELEFIEQQIQDLEKQERTLIENKRGIETLLTIFEQHGEEIVRNWTPQQFIETTNKNLKVVQKNWENLEYQDLILEEYKKDLSSSFSLLFDVGV